MITILIVDDSRLARNRLTDTILNFDIECKVIAEAKDGKEGLAKFKDLKPDVVITDIEMPNMNGIELLKEIRAIDKQVNIIVVSSIVNEQIKQEIISYNYTKYVEKPIDEKIIKQILSRRLLQLIKKGV